MQKELDKLCVKTSLDLPGEEKPINQGTGTIIHSENYYVLTAEHCIYGKDREYIDKVNYENVVVEWQNQYNSAFIPIKVKRIVASCQKNDWALLEIENPNIDFDFTSVGFASGFVEGERICFSGYQVLNKEEFAPFHGSIKTIADNEFKIEADFKKYSEGGDIARGLSGSGVFIEKASKYYLIGHLKKIIGDDALNNHVKCCPISECVPIKDNVNDIPIALSIRNLVSFSGGLYNPIIENEVKRDNIIQTIEKKLDGLDILFIDGEEGVGKTTILHQFISKYVNNCFAYFIDVKDSSSYSNLSILQAFCNQLYFAINQYGFEEKLEKEFYDEDFLKKYFSSKTSQLTSNKKSNQIFYFIIDGLDKMSKDVQNEIRDQILDKVPYDKSNVKLILTGKPNKALLKNGCLHDKLEMIVLSKQDSHAIFDSNISSDTFDKINKVSQNNAGKIVFLRNLVKNGFSLDIIIDKLSSDMKALYEYLWNNNKPNEISNLLLAVLAFNDKKYEAESLAKLLNIKESEVLALLSSIPFIRKNLRGTYEYIFDGFANFAKKKLVRYKNKIDKIIIDYLLEI